jgi:hypothetical protein
MNEILKKELELYYGSLLYELDNAKKNNDYFLRRKLEGKIKSINILLETNYV